MSLAPGRGGNPLNRVLRYFENYFLSKFNFLGSGDFDFSTSLSI